MKTKLTPQMQYNQHIAEFNRLTKLSCPYTLVNNKAMAKVAMGKAKALTKIK